MPRSSPQKFIVSISLGFLVVLSAPLAVAGSPPSGEKLALLSLFKAMADQERCEVAIGHLRMDEFTTPALQSTKAKCDQIADRANATYASFAMGYPDDVGSRERLLSAIHRLGISHQEICATGADIKIMSRLGLPPC